MVKPSNQKNPLSTPVQSKMKRTGEASPLLTNINDKIRPLLDAVDRLRHLKITTEGIQLPTIVVVGDQSSGKSSVLESLAGISLPRGQGICTRVPLIMRLQNHPTPGAELFLEYNGKTIPTDEEHISLAISNATDEIAGNGKGISNTPLTLIVKKQGVPDLTMVDLPGITRLPVHGQPENIYEQISSIIGEYISPKESIILNVLSATVDFSTCESILMSKRVDKDGERTLAVVTKADRAPEGLLEKVTADDVNIGLGYVCVRNRIGNESYEEARVEEARMFNTDPLLSKIDKSIVGIPVLAQKLVQIQATSISKCLPDIVKKINNKLNQNLADLERMPQNLSTMADAMTAFMRIISSAKDSLRKILVRGEFDEYDEYYMHCTARLAEMLNDYSEELRVKSEKQNFADKFLIEEIEVLAEAKAIGLPNFLPRTAFLTILQRKVKEISSTPIDFVMKVWNYIEDVMVRVITFHSDAYPQLQNSTRRATENLITEMREKSINRVKEIVEMEKIADYTCNSEYMTSWKALMAQQDAFYNAIYDDKNKQDKFTIAEYGEVKIQHLREYSSLVSQAFDMNMRLTAYWKIVLKRLVDTLALHLLYSIHNLINTEIEAGIINELMGPTGGGIERLLEESPSMASKREKLNKSIKLLKDSKTVLSKIMDRIIATGDFSD